MWKVNSHLVNALRESNSKGVADGDPEGAGGCRGENLFKLEALDRKASIGVVDLGKKHKSHGYYANTLFSCLLGVRSKTRNFFLLKFETGLCCPGGPRLLGQQVNSTPTPHPCSFFDKISYRPVQSGTHYVAEDDFELQILMTPIFWMLESQALYTTPISWITKAQTQGSVHAKQALYPLNRTPAQGQSRLYATEWKQTVYKWESQERLELNARQALPSKVLTRPIA